MLFYTIKYHFLIFSGQMFLLDRFFDGTFFTYGIEVMSFADRDQVRFNDAICLLSIGLYRHVLACIGRQVLVSTRGISWYWHALEGISRMYRLVCAFIKKYGLESVRRISWYWYDLERIFWYQQDESAGIGMY